MTQAARARADATLDLIDGALEDDWLIVDGMRWAPPEPNFDCPPLPVSRWDLTRQPVWRMHEEGLDGWAAHASVDWDALDWQRAALAVMRRELGRLGEQFQQQMQRFAEQGHSASSRSPSASALASPSPSNNRPTLTA